MVFWQCETTLLATYPH